MEKELLEGYTILLGGVKDVKAVVVKALLDSSDMENVVRYRHVPFEEVVIGWIDDEVDVYVKTDEFSLASEIVREYEGGTEVV
ncbi:MAG: hypothetical protein IKM61_09915 [Eubacteriaceae bacterium]|nr:hypothetical protein [Eubacteriaceae bacterium]